MPLSTIPHLPADWQQALQPELGTDYFTRLLEQVAHAYATQTVYPPPCDLWTAFRLTPLAAVKVVILGQDPYHQAGQAQGLAFSVPEGTPPPPSLRNIFAEIQSDVGPTTTTSTDLTRWANQGVLLLNSTLTVAGGQAGSHQTLGWENFTDAVIRVISAQQPAVAFLLWGAHAQSKQPHIDTSKHLILTAPHPSPLSAYRGFFGCRHFSTTNEWLSTHGHAPITW